MKRIFILIVLTIIVCPINSWATPNIIKIHISSPDEVYDGNSYLHDKNDINKIRKLDGYLTAFWEKDIGKLHGINGHLYGRSGYIDVLDGVLWSSGSGSLQVNAHKDGSNNIWDYSGSFLFSDGAGEYNGFYYDNYLTDDLWLNLWGNGLFTTYLNDNDYHDKWLGLDLYGHKVIEPSTLLLFSAGLFGLVIIRRGKTKDSRFLIAR